MAEPVTGIEVPIWEQSTVWAQQHWPDLAIGIPAVFMAIVLTEFIKGWVKMFLAVKLKERFTETLEKNVVRSLVFPLSLIPSLIFGFPARFNSMTGTAFELGLVAGHFTGMTLTAGVALLTYIIIKDISFVKAIRVMLYKRMGVTQDEVDAAKER